MARRIRSRREASARATGSLRFHQDVQACSGRRRVSLLRHDARVSGMVREESARLARVWPRLIIGESGAIRFGFPDATQDVDADMGRTLMWGGRPRPRRTSWYGQ